MMQRSRRCCDCAAATATLRLRNLVDEVVCEPYGTHATTLASVSTPRHSTGRAPKPHAPLHTGLKLKVSQLFLEKFFQRAVWTGWRLNKLRSRPTGSLRHALVAIRHLLLRDNACQSEGSHRGWLGVVHTSVSACTHRHEERLGFSR